MRNSGVLARPPTHERTAEEGGRTIIVTGVARSGTSMVSAILAQAKISMGQITDDIVFEDNEIKTALDNFDMQHLGQIIDREKESHGTWGFKKPHIHVHGPGLISLFRNPIMIVILRDPVAIAGRNIISEHFALDHSLAEASIEIMASIRFALSLDCPVLFISYEKALSDPELFVAELCKFCDLSPDVETRGRMVDLVQEDRPEYLQFARRMFEGYIDGFDRSTIIGWAAQLDLESPLTLDIFLDGKFSLTTAADVFREDLCSCGFGTGCHGFSVDLAPLDIGDQTKVDVRVTGRTFSLQNSGLTVEELRRIL